MQSEDNEGVASDNRKAVRRGRQDLVVYLLVLFIAAYLLFLALVSFYLPDGMSGRRAARAGADELFFLVSEFRLRWWNLRDISINVLLYMPLGYLVALFLARRQRLRRAGIYLWLGVLLSLGAETVQAFIGRFSDATDVVSNGAGYVLGFLFARSLILGSDLYLTSVHGKSDLGTRFHFLPGMLLYCLLLLSISLSPYDFDLSLQAVGTKLLEDSNLIPFRVHFAGLPLGAAVDIFRELVLYAPLGGFLALWLRTSGGWVERRVLLHSGGIGLLFGVLVELLQLTVVSRFVDVTDVLLAAAGAAGGALITTLFLPGGTLQARNASQGKASVTGMQPGADGVFPDQENSP